jgi:3-isopropylmalate dehydrogenase
VEALIGILAGDGIGPEVMREGIRALKAVEKAGGHKFELIARRRWRA